MPRNFELISLCGAKPTESIGHGSEPEVYRHTILAPEPGAMGRTLVKVILHGPKETLSKSRFFHSDAVARDRLMSSHPARSGRKVESSARLQSMLKA